MATVTGMTAEETETRLGMKVDATALPELIDDRVDQLIIAGSGITKVYDDTANTLTLSASGGGGGGGITSIFGARRLQCTTFDSFYLSGRNTTVVSCTGWTDMGAILTDSTYDPQAPVCLVASDGSGFDTQDAGIYVVRFSTSIEFANDAGTPSFVTELIGGYYQNRPQSGIHKTVLTADAGARQYGTGPGVYFETYIPPHQRLDWDPDDGSYYLSMPMQWPGNIASSTTSANVFADVIRLG